MSKNQKGRLDPSRFIAVDYHRNGVSGDPFVVGLYDDPGGGRKLIIYFPGGDCSVAVLDVDEAVRGNVYMHPVQKDGQRVDGTGGNAWRGDHYADVAEAMRQALV
jgi:hypothetical protein